MKTHIIPTSKNSSKKTRARLCSTALVVALTAAGSTALAADEASDGLSITGQEVDGFADGVRAMMCNEVGFLAFVWAIDEELRSPQFPDAKVQYSDGVIAVTDSQEINGISTPQSAYLVSDGPRNWAYSGFRGIRPVTDSCTDITLEIADSFVDFAMAASWGMPKVEQRVDLFAALEDDLRTRLELAEAEKDRVSSELAVLRDEFSDVETELALAQMAVCEIANHTREMLVDASFSETPAATENFTETVTKAFGSANCGDGISNAVYASSDTPGPR